MKSVTKIKKQAEKKTSSDLVETILNTVKNKKWIEVAHVISMPRRNRVSMNLDEIGKVSKDGETVLVPGKVLSQGEVKKKIKIIALAFSKNSMEKLSGEKVDFATISEEIKKNPDANGIRILR